MSTNCGCPENQYNITTDCVPCEDTRCGSEMDAKCVIYRRGQYKGNTGLTCMGLSTNENLQTILEEIDDRLCDVVSSSLTFTNGLNKILNDVKLGGDLIENTLIDLDSFTLLITGEDFRFTDYTSARVDTPNGSFLFTDVDGKLNVGNFETAVVEVTDVLYEVPLTFDNGLTRTAGSPDNVRLGGDLEIATNIGAGNSDLEVISNSLHIRNHTAFGPTGFGAGESMKVRITQVRDVLAKNSFGLNTTLYNGASGNVSFSNIGKYIYK